MKLLREIAKKSGDNAIHASIHNGDTGFLTESKFESPFGHGAGSWRPSLMHKKLAAHYTHFEDSKSGAFNPEKYQTKEYTDDSSHINSYHWERHQKECGKNADSERETKYLDSAMTKHKTPEDMTVHTGIHYDPRDMTNSTGIVKHPAYLSTSLRKNIAIAFGSSSPTAHGPDKEIHTMKIHVPKGSPGAYVGHNSHNPKEEEFILPRKSKLQHMGTTTSKIEYGNPKPTDGEKALGTGGIYTHHEHEMKLLK